MILLGWRKGKSASLIDSVVDSALGPVCSVILITGAGGMFGGVLRSSGIGNAVADSLDAIGLPVIVAGFVIAAVVWAATRGGARALGVETGPDAVGSLGIGSHADLHVLDAPTIAHLAYRPGVPLTAAVWRHGIRSAAVAPIGETLGNC